MSISHKRTFCANELDELSTELTDGYEMLRGDQMWLNFNYWILKFYSLNGNLHLPQEFLDRGENNSVK